MCRRSFAARPRKLRQLRHLIFDAEGRCGVSAYRSPLSPGIRIRSDVKAEMVARCVSAPHTEVCGLLAGADGEITRLFPATNAAAEPASGYEIAPAELFRLMREIRAAGLEQLGIYHSHPQGANQPSARDIERAYYPDAAYFVISPRPTAPKPVRAFSIRDGIVTEVNVETVD